jgi:hypothetical protein
MVQLSLGLEGASSRWLLRLAAETMWLYLLFHLLEFLMGIHFRAEAGFGPVWWIDCPGCADPGFSLPYGLPAIGGVSVPGVVSWVAGGVLIFGTRLDDRIVKPTALVFAATTTVHLVMVFAAQFPSPIAGLLMGLLMPAASAVLATAAVLDWSPGTVPLPDSPGSTIAVVGLVVGMIVMLALASLGTPLVGVGYAVWAWNRVSTWQRRLVLAGLLLTTIATVGRIVLATSYPLYFWWV